MGDLVMEEDRPFPFSAFAAPLCNPDPSSIRAETWVVVDDPARELLNCIRPTLDSEEKRKDVIEYVQKLIRCSLGVEVFPYGSVPLKTYLPDGDIDLTALSTPNVEDSLPRDVLAVLQAEELNGDSEFVLKDTQFIDAEVKLVKCVVQDIVIDISFNQLGGLCSLCFLEQVDRLIGRDHLFKRSIILIKMWCYYESRILGAHHGLISTYALETLILYIFHVFNATFSYPIEVLYRFLDYYSKFDWDNYCISLDGPVCKSSLPNIEVKNAVNRGNDVLLSGEFLKQCMDMFIAPSKGLETNVRPFPPKFLNIIDPLKENNNLGRSVNIGNYYRIRSAFRFGARKLGRILQQPNEKIGDEIKKFFTNTLQRHKLKNGPDSAFILGAKEFGTLSTSSLSEAYCDDDVYSKFSNGDFDDYTSSLDDVRSIEANDVSAFRALSLKSAIEKSDSERNTHDAPSSYIDSNGYLSDSIDGKSGFELWMDRKVSQIVDGDTICVDINNNNNNDNSLTVDFREKDVGESETLNPLADLIGDYDSHVRSLLYGQCCHGYALSAAVVPPHQNINPWEVALRHQDSSSYQVNNANGYLMGHTPYLVDNNPTPAFDMLQWEERSTARGTGPYFPLMNSHMSNEGTRARGRGRNRGPYSNGHQMQRARGGSNETNFVLEANQDGSSPRGRSPRLGRGRFGSSNQTQVQAASHANSTTNNGFANSPRRLEFGSFGPMPRMGEEAFHLKNEEEFPPLSA